MNKSLGKYIAKKLVYVILLMAAASILTFLLMKASPVDPLQSDVGQTALGSMSEQQIAKLRLYWGTEGAWGKQYLAWIKTFLGGDMGTSLYYRQPVSQVIGQRLSNSLPVIGIAWLISGVAGFLLGAAAGMNQGKWIDKIVKGYCLVISSTTASWVALVLLLVFGVWLQVLPIGLSVPIGVDSISVTIADRIRHAVLPTMTLSMMGISQIALHTREKMMTVRNSDFMLFATARGERGFSLFWQHGLRNIALPAITLHFSAISRLFGGSILVEQVFSYPGMGQAVVTAGMSSDLPLLSAIAVISVLFVFGGNTIADVLYHLIDPRIRRAGSK